MMVKSNIVENWVSRQRNDTMPLNCCSIYLVKRECDVALKAPMSMVVMRNILFRGFLVGERRCCGWTEPLEEFWR